MCRKPRIVYKILLSRSFSCAIYRTSAKPSLLCGRAHTHEQKRCLHHAARGWKGRKGRGFALTSDVLLLPAADWAKPETYLLIEHHKHVTTTLPGRRCKSWEWRGQGRGGEPHVAICFSSVKRKLEHVSKNGFLFHILEVAGNNSQHLATWSLKIVAQPLSLPQTVCTATPSISLVVYVSY